jgi:hypothetical protein
LHKNTGALRLRDLRHNTAAGFALVFLLSIDEDVIFFPTVSQATEQAAPAAWEHAFFNLGLSAQEKEDT